MRLKRKKLIYEGYNMSGQERDHQDPKKCRNY